MKKLVFLVLLILALGLPPVAGHATMYTTLASWEAAVSSSANVNLAGQVKASDFLYAGSPLNLPQGGTVSFNADLYGVQVPEGWAWSGGNNPRILWNFTSSTPDYSVYFVNATFSAGQTAFGLEMAPDDISAAHLMTLDLGGGNVLTQNVNGPGGALFFGYVGAPITTMTLSSDIDFAFGRMVQGTAAVPLPASALLLGSGLLALVGWRRFRKS